jgi:hypothetical protein
MNKPEVEPNEKELAIINTLRYQGWRLSYHNTTNVAFGVLMLLFVLFTLSGAALSNLRFMIIGGFLGLAFYLFPEYIEDNYVKARYKRFGIRKEVNTDE